MTSVVEICNSAINSLGASNITALTENAKNARLCNQRYEPIRDAVFRTHYWNCLIKRVQLAADTTTPAYEYDYQYTLPADTIDLLDHVIRTDAGNTTTQADLTISRIGVSTYASIPNKLTTGRPIQVFIERLITPRINLWPVPDTSYTFVYFRMRRVQDAGNGAETPDIVFRFLPCLVAGLAYHIAMKVPELAPRIEMLKAVYDEQYALAAGEDREKTSENFVPRIGRI